MKWLIAIILGTITCFGLCTSVQAADVTLSLYSSDETPAAWLDAAIDFTVVDSTLTIEVDNLTDGPDWLFDLGYDINRIYFNATNNVSDLTLNPISGWELVKRSEGDTHAGGFGAFDFALIDGVGSDPDLIEGETSKVFTLSISGAGVVESNFYTELSTIPPGGSQMIVAAKFIRGPCDDSAFGGVPEPTTIVLLGLGSLGLIRRKLV